MSNEYLLDDYEALTGTEGTGNPYRAAFLDCEDECVEDTSITFEQALPYIQALFNNNLNNNLNN